MARGVKVEVEGEGDEELEAGRVCLPDCLGEGLPFGRLRMREGVNW